MARPRIDLDGVPLTDPEDPYMPLAVFRFRTTEGLVLLLPESAEIIVGWEDVASASVDLTTAELRITFRPSFAAGQSWLRGTATLVGSWLDRRAMTAAEAGATRVGTGR